MMNINKKAFIFLSIVLVFTSCKTSKESDTTTNNTAINTATSSEQERYLVSNFKEFLDALGNDRTVVLTEDIYIKEELLSVLVDDSRFFAISDDDDDVWITPEYQHEFYSIYGPYSSSVDSRESLMANNYSDFIKDDIILILKNMDNLTITSINSSNIVIRQSDNEVIRFDSLTNLTLNNLSIYHDPATDGGCGEYAPVIVFYDSKNITIDKCKLNGSGTEGFMASNVTHLLVENTEIFNCTKRGLSLEYSSDVVMNNCKIHANKLDAIAEYWDGPSIFYLIESDIAVSNTTIGSNSSVEVASFVDMDANSEIVFKSCNIMRNTNFVLTEEEKKKFNINSL